jgi:predicted DNA-binding transcriptional regulator YafY
MAIQSSARLLELPTLLQARRHWTGAELAERLEVTPRTVRRDVERLRTPTIPGGRGRARQTAVRPPSAARIAPVT